MPSSDSNSNFNQEPTFPFRSHGMSNTLTYQRWVNMLTRCCNPRSKSYPNYGGRGITVCERWQNFENFYADMGEPPPNCTIERVNNELGYSPENCKWEPKKVQARNTRVNRYITIGNETYCAAEWAERRDIKYSKVMERLYDGWTPEEALEFIQRTTPNVDYITANGETHSRKEWAKLRGLTKSALRNRLDRGWTSEQALGFQKAPPRSRWTKRARQA